MTVADLIEKLKELPQDLEVKITDGYETHFYQGDFIIEIFEDLDGSSFVDIGIGGLMVDADELEAL